MTRAKQQVILTFHLYFHSFSLPERDLPHLQQQKTKPSHLPVACSIPGEMCEHGQMFELLELMGKRKKNMFLSDARDCMKPFNTDYVAEDGKENWMMQNHINGRIDMCQ